MFTSYPGCQSLCNRILEFLPNIFDRSFGSRYSKLSAERLLINSVPLLKSVKGSITLASDSTGLLKSDRVKCGPVIRSMENGGLRNVRLSPGNHQALSAAENYQWQR